MLSTIQPDLVILWMLTISAQCNGLEIVCLDDAQWVKVIIDNDIINPL